MNERTRLKISMLVILLILVSGVFWFLRFVKTRENNIIRSIDVPLQNVSEPASTPEDSRLNADKISSDQKLSPETVVRDAVVKQLMPFTAQAPSGQWSEKIFQDACEEVSVLMAYAWAQGQEKLPVAEVERDIRAMSAWELKRFGSDVDLSPEDTAVLMREYWKWEAVSVKDTVSKQDIIDALYDGAVVIVPTNGKALKNPFYTAGGPDRHMLVIIGYNPKQKQFITNDPGTKHGTGYRYKEDVLYGAIRAYPTGDHVPIIGGRKAAIIVRK